jgi:SP family myo-inositol transporter-like MFS transporter 13
MVVAKLSDRLGRKSIILIASFVFTIGSIIMAVAGNRWVLLAGRAVAGIAIGFASAVAPIYIAEMAPKHQRGSLVTLNHCFITFGQFSASLLAGLFTYLPNWLGWRMMLGFAGFPSLIQFVWFFFMPESPRWLMMKGREQEALCVLTQVYGDSQMAKAELLHIQQSQQASLEDVSRKRGTLKRILQTKLVRRALFIGCALQFFQQMVGVNTLMYYSTTIIQMAGQFDFSEFLVNAQ